MVSLFYWQAGVIAVLVACAASQATTIVPEDLQTGFGSDKVQVSFTDEAINGFRDGTIFEKEGQ